MVEVLLWRRGLQRCLRDTVIVRPTNHVHNFSLILQRRLPHRFTFLTRSTRGKATVGIIRSERKNVLKKGSEKSVIMRNAEASTKFFRDKHKFLSIFQVSLFFFKVFSGSPVLIATIN